jgi:hypothetical protein
MKKIFIYTLLFLLSYSCSKEEVSDLQSDYFIKFYGNFLQDNGYSVKETEDGGLVITGSIERLSTGKDIVLIKTDEYGNQADWSPVYFGTGRDDEGYAVEILEDGYLIAGSVTNDAGDKDAFFIETDLEGNATGNEFSYGGDGDQFPLSITERTSGGHMIVGYTNTPSSDSRSFFVVTLDDGLSNPRITRSSSRGQEFVKIIPGDNEYLALGNQYRNNSTEFFIVKLNETGNIFDLAFLGATNQHEILGDAVKVNDSTIFMLGTARNASDAEGRLLVKKVVNLKEEWTRIITGSGSFEGKSISATEDGNLIIAADKMLENDTNILIYFLDEDGNVLSSREYGETGDQTVEDIMYSGNKLVIVGGNAYEQNRMISLIKTDQNGNIWE